jgi:hypothetical protein
VVDEGIFMLVNNYVSRTNAAMLDQQLIATGGSTSECCGMVVTILRIVVSQGLWRRQRIYFFSNQRPCCHRPQKSMKQLPITLKHGIGFIVHQEQMSSFVFLGIISLVPL